MTTPRFVLSLPQTDNPDRFFPLVILLEAGTKTNVYHLLKGLQNGRPYPRLYESGIYYKEEKPGHEDWPDIPSLLAQGWGDCEDLAMYRAAELRVYDRVAAVPVIKWKFIPSRQLKAAGYPRKSIPRDGIWLVHCLVRYPDGTIEDPSKILGMKGEYS